MVPADARSSKSKSASRSSKYEINLAFYDEVMSKKVRSGKSSFSGLSSEHLKGKTIKNVMTWDRKTKPNEVSFDGTEGRTCDCQREKAGQRETPKVYKDKNVQQSESLTRIERQCAWVQTETNTNTKELVSRHVQTDINDPSDTDEETLNENKLTTLKQHALLKNTLSDGDICNRRIQLERKLRKLEQEMPTGLKENDSEESSNKDEEEEEKVLAPEAEQIEDKNPEQEKGYRYESCKILPTLMSIKESLEKSNSVVVKLPDTEAQNESGPSKESLQMEESNGYMNIESRESDACKSDIREKIDQFYRQYGSGFLVTSKIPQKSIETPLPTQSQPARRTVNRPRMQQRPTDEYVQQETEERLPEPKKSSESCTNECLHALRELLSKPDKLDKQGLLQTLNDLNKQLDGDCPRLLVSIKNYMDSQVKDQKTEQHACYQCFMHSPVAPVPPARSTSVSNQGCSTSSQATTAPPVKKFPNKKVSIREPPTMEPHAPPSPVKKVQPKSEPRAMKSPRNSMPSYESPRRHYDALEVNSIARLPNETTKCGPSWFADASSEKESLDEDSARVFAFYFKGGSKEPARKIKKSPRKNDTNQQAWSTDPPQSSAPKQNSPTNHQTSSNTKFSNIKLDLPFDQTSKTNFESVHRTMDMLMSRVYKKHRDSLSDLGSLEQKFENVDAEIKKLLSEAISHTNEKKDSLTTIQEIINNFTDEQESR